MRSIVNKYTNLFPVLCSLLFVPVPLFSQTLITAEPFWRQALGGEVLSLPHVQVQSAVVALDGGNIRAYSSIGTPMWNYSARGRISPFVTRSPEGSSYISRTNGMFIAINRSGRELWRRNLEEPLSAKVAIGWDGRLFIPTEKKIFCYTASGNLLWTKTFESSFTIAPKLDRDGGILFTLENKVYQLDPFGNEKILTLSSPPSFVFLPENRQITVIYPNGAVEIPEEQKEETAEDLPAFPARLLAANSRENEIAAVMTDGRVSLFSITERKILWTAVSHIRSGQAAEAEILFDERGIYVLSKSGASYYTHAGRRNWYTILENAAAVPAFGDDGVLYSGGTDWILYAYKMEERILQRTATIYGPAPEGSYGMTHPKTIYNPRIPLSQNERNRKLVEIKNGVTAGNVGSNEPDWVSFLMTLSSDQESVVNRITALQILGKLGSRETVPWLVNIYKKEIDPALKVAAINAIGNIGVDPEGNALQTILNSITPGVKNEQLAYAIISTTGALCRFSGPPLAEPGIRILNILSAGNQPAIIRRQAEREMASLR